MNMNQLRKQQRHCDVTINMNGKKFPCHRIVLSSSSSYFNVMFNGKFDESKSDNITIAAEIDSETFEEVLNAMYTANISITQQNAYHLWKACSFFGMPVFENRCVSFIENNLPVENLMEVCFLASVLKKEALLKAVVGFMSENIVDLAKTVEFSQFPLDIFKMILSQEKLQHIDDDVLCSIIIAWVKKNADDNVELTKNLLEIAKLAKISVSLMAALITNPSTFNEIDSIAEEDSDAMVLAVSLLASSRPTMKVYVKAVNDDRTSSAILGLSYEGPGKWTVTEKLPALSNLKTVVIEDRQYFLGYDRNTNSEAIFWMIEDGKRTQLREPPIITKHYHLAASENTVYLYCSLSREKKAYASTFSTFWKEMTVVDNCLFAYNCDFNYWSAIPKITTPVRLAAFAAHKKGLYVIGGLPLSTDAECNKVGIQLYDHRTAYWTSVTADITSLHYAAACVVNSRIYWNGGQYKNIGYCTTRTDYIETNPNERYRNTSTEMNSGKIDHALVVFNEHLYAIASKPHLSVEKYCTNENPGKWIVEPPLPKKVACGRLTFSLLDITDAVVY